MDLVTEVADRAARRLIRWETEAVRRHTPELPPGPLAPERAQLLSFLLTPGPFLRACRERYGKVVTIRVTGLPPIVQFSDPDAVREVFATGDDVMHAGEANAVLEPFLGAYSVLVLDGARHRSQRRLLLPPFRGERMRAYGEAMRDITASAIAKWPRAPGGGARFVLQRETQAITLDVILRTVFGMEDGADQDRMRALLARALRISTTRSTSSAPSRRTTDRSRRGGVSSVCAGRSSTRWTRSWRGVDAKGSATTSSRCCSKRRTRTELR